MICTNPNDPYLDEWQTDRGRGIWIAGLSDGTQVYSDDFRPDVSPWNAWERMRSHCLENELHVVSMQLAFRNRKIPLPLPAENNGAFLVRGILQLFGLPPIDIINIGHVQGETVYYQKWRLPELQMLGSDTRLLSDCPPQQVIPCLGKPAHSTPNS